MLRLHPSTIVLTHDEVNKVLTKTSPSSPISPESTGATPWDRNIILRRQERKGKQRAESRAEVRLDLDDRTLLANFRELSLGTDSDNVYNGRIEEEDLIDMESLFNVTGASINNAGIDNSRSETQPPQDEDNGSASTLAGGHKEELVRRINQWKARNYCVSKNSEELGWRIYQAEDPEDSSGNDSNGTEHQAGEELELSELSGTLSYSRVRRTTRSRQINDVMEELEQEEIGPEGANEAFIETSSVENYSSSPQFSFPVQNFQDSSRISWASSPYLEDDVPPNYHDPISSRMSTQSSRMQPARPQTVLPTRELPQSFGVNGSRDNISIIFEEGSVARVPQGRFRFLNDVWRRRNLRIDINDPGSNGDVYDDDDYISDDSLSGVQLPADVVATLGERTEKLQIEAAKKTIR